MLSKKERFKRIIKDIKSIKIQGAVNVAKEGLKAYFMFPSKNTKEKILSLRPTEPTLNRVLDLAEKGFSKKEILNHFDEAQNKINKIVFKLLKNKEIIFTHCHSSNVINALIYAKKHNKKFEVINTETRPLFQGRKTAKELRKAGIKVTTFIDSGAKIAITKGKGNCQVDEVFFGADALLENGVINKIGSDMFAEIAYENNVPVYIIADSWKFTNKDVQIEQRSLNEIWDKAPKKIKIKNPAFEFINKKYISGIITELGLMKYSSFVKLIKKIS